jgi:hypothetical protein
VDVPAPVRIRDFHFHLAFLHERVVGTFYWSLPTLVAKPFYQSPPLCYLGQRHSVRYSAFRSISSIIGRSLS